ncbi:calcium/sodium antiporter [[Eubacterium] cellulosolvens]
MFQLLIGIIALIIGLIFLIKGSDLFVDGAANAALIVGVSEHVIGITLVAFATSLPELATASVASIEGLGDLAFGNVVGSNIANICLVLGFTAVLINIKPAKESMRDVLFMNLVVILLVLVIIDKKITKLDALIFLCAFSGYFYYLWRTINVGSTKKEGSIAKELVLIIFGLVGVVIGAWLLVEGAVRISDFFSISTAIIGLTIVAVGTSLPELATSITAAIKGKIDISLGNVLGSNIINILLVLGIAALFNDIDLSGLPYSGDVLLKTTFPILIFTSLLTFVYAKRKITRIQGIFLLGIYVVFIYLLYAFSISLGD